MHQLLVNVDNDDDANAELNAFDRGERRSIHWGVEHQLCKLVKTEWRLMHQHFNGTEVDEQHTYKLVTGWDTTRETKHEYSTETATVNVLTTAAGAQLTKGIATLSFSVTNQRTITSAVRHAVTEASSWRHYEAKEETKQFVIPSRKALYVYQAVNTFEIREPARQEQYWKYATFPRVLAKQNCILIRTVPATIKTFTEFTAKTCTTSQRLRGAAMPAPPAAEE